MPVCLSCPSHRRGVCMVHRPAPNILRLVGRSLFALPAGWPADGRRVHQAGELLPGGCRAEPKCAGLGTYVQGCAAGSPVAPARGCLKPAVRAPLFLAPAADVVPAPPWLQDRTSICSVPLLQIMTTEILRSMLHKGNCSAVSTAGLHPFIFPSNADHDHRNPAVHAVQGRGADPGHRVGHFRRGE